MTSYDEDYSQNLKTWGVGARSGPRSADYFNGADEIVQLQENEHGIQFRISTPRYIGRGRDIYITISNQLIDDVHARRHRDAVEAIETRLSKMEAKLVAIRSILEEESTQ